MPGAGGLCCHALLFDQNDPERMWCGISAVGVFRTDDGGATWTPKNQGVPAALEDKRHKGIGTCVHGLAQDPDDPGRIDSEVERYRDLTAVDLADFAAGSLRPEQRALLRVVPRGVR